MDIVRHHGIFACVFFDIAIKIKLTVQREAEYWSVGRGKAQKRENMAVIPQKFN
jgi:hypothetical protein